MTKKRNDDRVIHKTPPLTVLFPHLRTPDQYENGPLKFNVTVRLDAEQAEAFTDRHQAEHEQAHELAMATINGFGAAKKKKALADYKRRELLKEDVDPETGEETGDFLRAFSTSAKYTPKIGRNKGKEMTRVVPIYDAKGKAMPQRFDIGYGSKVIVAYTTKPFPDEGKVPTMGSGVAFYLESVQVIKYCPPGSGGPSADSYGFEAHEDGFSAEDGEFDGNDDEDDLTDGPDEDDEDEDL